MKKKNFKLIDVLKRFKLESLAIGTNCATVTLSYTNWDSEAAWQLYVELITRVTSQPLIESAGDEKTALDSVHSIFGTTREILKNFGKNAKSFTPLSLLLLNRIIRPFTSRWHKLFVNGPISEQSKNVFRNELESLRLSLVSYIELLADMAGVEPFIV